MNTPDSSTSTEPRDFRVARDVAYLSEDRAEKADLYLPTIPEGKRVPAVLVIHGGGFRIGNKDNVRVR